MNVAIAERMRSLTLLPRPRTLELDLTDKSKITFLCDSDPLKEQLH